MTQESTLATVSTSLADFADFVQSTMTTWKVHGLAVAIIKDNQVILCQGFGLRDVEHKKEVTPQTLFPIASCTKAFTAAALAILADEGKMDWDTPVRAYLPTFKLHDPVATERITPRDLVSHRSGLPRHDLMWYNSSASRQQLFDRLQFLEPTKDFRSLWQYQNLMYMAAGYLVGQLSGSSWEEFVQTHLFNRLDMPSSNFDILATTEQATDFSHPYREVDEVVKEIPVYAAQGAIAPAGAIVSNITELSHWVLMHLNQGKYNDSHIVSPGQVTQQHSPQMIIPETGKFSELPYSSYALGWFVQPYRGHPMIHHGGNIDGFSSLTTLLPRAHIGVVVLSNMSASPVPAILTYNIADRLLGMDQIPWSERFMQDHLEIKAAEKKGKEKSASDAVPGTSPSHPLAAYAGEFAHPGYGQFLVEHDGDQLQATFNHMTFPLKHYHYDIFEAIIERFDIDLKFSFTTNVQGDIDTVIAPLEPTAQDIVFKRVPAGELTTKSFLEKFTGAYEILGMTMIVSLKGENALVVSIPMQPEYELVPYKNTEFHVKGLSGLSFSFEIDANGQVTAAIISQPGGVFTAKKKGK